MRDTGLISATGVGILGAALRALAVPRAVGDVDSVNFARSLVAFDPLHQAPHLPGYPVFVLCARAMRAAGIHSDPWALCLVPILLWPIAAVLLYLGARRWLGSKIALGVVVAASLAPGAVVVGGWPASDGLGLALLAASVGALGIATSPTTGRPTDHRWAALGGLGIGLALGVRLSWWPAVAAILLLVAWHRRSAALTVLSGSVVAVLAWSLPLVFWIGPGELWHHTWGFASGHLTGWGHTALVGDVDLSARLGRAAWGLWTAGLGGSWPGVIPMAPNGSASTWSEPAGIGLTLAVIATVAGGRYRFERSVTVHRLAILVIAAIPYGLWVLVCQNVTKPRHLVLLLPVAGALAAAALGSHRWRRLLAPALVASLLVVGFGRAQAQRRVLVPALALVKTLAAERSPELLQIFAGQEARVLEHHLPMYRVLRPANAEVLTAEASRLAELGVEVWVTSETPGVAALQGRLEPIARFDFPVQVRPQDAALTLYRLAQEGAP